MQVSLHTSDFRLSQLRPQSCRFRILRSQTDPPVVKIQKAPDRVHRGAAGPRAAAVAASALLPAPAAGSRAP
eukprot:COSAG06_NODE_22819_length_711_cov_2.743464_3_plen_71_part_01